MHAQTFLLLTLQLYIYRLVNAKTIKLAVSNMEVARVYHAECIACVRHVYYRTKIADVCGLPYSQVSIHLILYKEIFSISQRG
jgi:hypothetical protein